MTGQRCQRHCAGMSDNAIQTALPCEAGFIDEKQLLARLPVSRRTLFNWRTTGKIPSIKIGRRILYHLPSVEAALLRQQKGTVQ